MTSARPTTQKLTQGFTLIELLVVLGILGILATALVATIDPFEQLKKASDSNAKNAAVEFVNASLRYYTTHNGMPWADATNGGKAGCGVDGVVSGARLDGADGDVSVDGDGSICVGALIEDGELKTQFTSSTAITKAVWVSGVDNATTKTATACFLASSKSQQRDPGTIYDSKGEVRTPIVGSVGAGGVNTAKCGVGGTDVTGCYWCAAL